ncbi:MAG: S8 family serine peptidase [Halobacteriales archaeon]
MSTRQHYSAILFSIVMVLSMVAFATAGAGAAPGANTQGEDIDQTSEQILEDEDVLVSQSQLDAFEEPGDIDEELLSNATEEPVKAVVRVVKADRQQLPREEDAVPAALKAHADATQEPVKDAAGELDNVEVLNSLWITNAVLVEADAEGLQEIAQVPGVDRIHPNFELERPEPVETNESGAGPTADGYTYGLEQTNVPDAWDQFGTQGDGAKVAVLDTGVDIDHPDIELFTEDSNDPTYPGGWAEFDSDGNMVPGSEPHDTSDHGTHTSGTVGAHAPDGSDPVYGVAPEADMGHGLVIPGGSGSFVQVGAGIEWAADEDYDVISLSLGANGYITDNIEMVENARDAGSLVVAAIGNQGPFDPPPPGYSGSPGNYWSSVGVGATDVDEEIASFSLGEEDITHDDWGGEAPDYWPDGYTVPAVAAPGVDVFSAQPGGGYQEISGTSMAAPHVAGIATLAVSHAGGDIDDQELFEIIENATWKPDDWPEPEDERDNRYGSGIVDTMEVLGSIQSIGPEDELGDVDEDGNVTIDDAVLIQQYLADMLPENATFNENLGDLDRDGNVTIDDAVKVQQKLAGMLDPGEIVVENVTGPDEISGGEMMEVTGNITNVGDEGAIENLKLHAEAMDGASTEQMMELEQMVDMAIEGVDTPVDRPHESWITFEVDTGELPGGDYQMGILSEDHDGWMNVTVTQPFFEVTDLDVPSEVDQGSTLEVNATIENTGNENDTQTVEMSFDGDAVDDTSVQLDPNESTTETFTFDTTDVSGGEYEVGVSTDDDEAAANTTVLEPFFEVDNVNAPEEVYHGDDIEVLATVENTGTAPAEQEITYEIGAGGAGTDIAVVGFEETGTEGNVVPEVLVDILEDELGSDFTVDHVHPDDLLDEMDNYDVFALHRFGETDDDNPGDALASDFYDALDTTQATVHFDTRSGATDAAYPSAIRRSNNVRGIPGEYQEDASGESGMPLEITEDHPIWTDIGDEGYEFDTNTAGFIGDDNPAAFDDYDGEIVGEDVTSGMGGVAIDDNPDAGLTEVLVTNAVPNWFTDSRDRITEDAETLMGNAVELAATGQVAQAGESASVIEPTEVTETIQLDPGEWEVIEFEDTVSSDVPVGDAAHVVSSEDDDASAPVTVKATDQIDITDVDAPAEALQGADISVEATLEHTGTESTTQTIEYMFDGDVADSTSVTMDPGDTETVTFNHTLPADIEPGSYDHTVVAEYDEVGATLDVLEAEPGTFEVTNLDAPGQAGQGDMINVSATVTNTGEIETTQTVEYIFGDEDDGGDEPTLDEADVAVVDLGDQTWTDDYVDILEQQLDDDVFTVDTITEDLVDQMPDYDVFLVHRFDSETNGQDFLDNLGEEQGAVYLSSWGEFGSNYPDAVETLESVRGDPASTEDNIDSAGETHHTILEDHPIFDGVGESGDTVFMKDTGYYVTWPSADDYDGETIASLSEDSSGSPEEGMAVGYDDDRNEVLLSALGMGSTTGDTLEDRQEAANVTMANAVNYVAEEALLEGSSLPQTTDFAQEYDDASAVSMDDVSVAPSEFVTQQTSEELTLEPGESTDVSFSYNISENEVLGHHDHGVYSEDDSATDVIDIYEQGPDIGVSGWFPDPDPSEETIYAGHPFTAEIVVVNDGELAGEKEIKLYDGETVLNSTTVELDPGEGTTVDLSTTFSPGTKIVSANGVSPIQFDVVDPTPADFDVTIDDAPSQVMWGDEVEVNATVENLGEAYETKDVTFAVNDSTIANESVTLGDYENESLTFTYDTVEDDVPEIDVNVSTEDDAAVETVAVDSPPEFDVSIDDTNAPVQGEETLEVNYSVENIGTLQGTQNITFNVSDAEEDTQELTLDGGETHNGTFTYDTTRDDIGELDVSVISANATDTETVTVEEIPAEFSVSNFEAPASADTGDEITVSATIENIGTASGTDDVEFSVNDSTESTVSTTLDGGETTNATFNYTVPSSSPDPLEVAIATADDSASGSIAINSSQAATAVHRPLIA